MHYITINSVIRLLVLLAVIAIAIQPATAVTMVENSNGPELPEACSSIAAPAGHKLAFHVYAKGVQIYKWNGFMWSFIGPEATLYAEENFFGEVGNHGFGPHWTSKSGSRVKADRVQNTGCRPDPDAIDWILLKMKETSGAGIFARVSYIQRTNTTGGVAPAEAGMLNEVKEIPYTAEYYFYREEGPVGQ